MATCSELPAGGGQLGKCFPGEDHDVASHAGGELRDDGLRPSPCDAPDAVVTLTPLIRSDYDNSGRRRR